MEGLRWLAALAVAIIAMALAFALFAYVQLVMSSPAPVSVHTFLGVFWLVSPYFLFAILAWSAQRTWPGMLLVFAAMVVFVVSSVLYQFNLMSAEPAARTLDHSRPLVVFLPLFQLVGFVMALLVFFVVSLLQNLLRR